MEAYPDAAKTGPPEDLQSVLLDPEVDFRV